MSPLLLIAFSLPAPMESQGVDYGQLIEEEEIWGLYIDSSAILSRHNLNVESCSPTVTFWKIPEDQ